MQIHCTCMHGDQWVEGTGIVTAAEFGARVSDQLSATCIIRHSHMEKKQWQKLGNTTEM